MDSLIRGIGRFQNGSYRQKTQLFAQLALGQRPHTLLITCSDSRLQPDLITGVEPGELFIVRNVGNIVPPFESDQVEARAAIEYATVALGVRDIVIMGHSHCGAIEGLLEPEHLVTLPAVASWLKYAEETRARTLTKWPNLSGEALLQAAIHENVIVQIEQLESFPFVAQRVAEGRVKVHGWVYEVESGVISQYSKDENSFLPITAEEVGDELTS